MTQRLLPLLFVAMITELASAQQLVRRYSGPFYGPLLWETRMPSACPQLPFPAPSPPPAPPQPPQPPNPPGFPLTNAPYPLGDLTYDNAAGRTVSTDGLGILIVPDRGLEIPPGTYQPGQYFAATPWLGPLTGLAADAASGVLWCTDGNAIVPTPLANPTVVLALPRLFNFTLLAPPMTGLDFDPLAGVLIGCDAGGHLYRFNAAGFPIGPQPWLLSQHPGGASDVAVPRHPGGIGGVFVQFHGGETVVDYAPCVTNAIGFGAWWLTNPGYGNGEGLAIAYRPDEIGSSCNFNGNIGATAPSCIGNASFGLWLAGQPPFSQAFLLLDLTILDESLPAHPSAWAPYCQSGGPQHLPLPPAGIIPAFADANGTTLVPIPLFLPPTAAGTEVYAQWVLPSPAPPSLLSLSPILRVRLALR